MDIYQELWNADLRGNALPAIRVGSARPGLDVGYVEVSENSSADTGHKVIADVAIPIEKQTTYLLCEQLFNNYVLDQTKPDPELREEPAEIDDFLDLAMASEVMEVARLYAQERTRQTFSPGRWHALMRDLWFGRFDSNSGDDLSGFEHVFVGEQKGSQLGGYHFWYKFYIDDSHDLKPAGEYDPFGKQDHIRFMGPEYRGAHAAEGKLVPEVITLSHTLHAFDFVAKQNRLLTKPVGGFFVGCSPEGLMAQGAIRALRAVRAPKDAVINGAKFDLKVFRSSNDRHIRTAYPIFLDQLEAPRAQPTRPPAPIPAPPPTPEPAAAEAPPTVPAPAGGVPVGAVRIVAALVNPSGNDAGMETVTLLNTCNHPVPLEGFVLADVLGRTSPMNGVIDAGETLRIPLTQGAVRFANKGGTITLRNVEGSAIHSVSYTRAQATKQGWTVAF